MFRNREDAGMRLAKRLLGWKFTQPLVLGVPSGGLVVGAMLAREIGAELDVVLSRRLRAPHSPEFAIGAISEDGRVYLHSEAADLLDISPEYLTRERQHQMSEIARMQAMFRKIRPRAAIAGRSVIVTDDGIATGSTMIAALQTVRAQHPASLIVAVPVAAALRLNDVREWCDDFVCLAAPEHLGTIGCCYDDFAPISDQQAVGLLRHTFAEWASV